ncbi:hypothetical protein GGI20_002410, partial [Coemansia sp. BCRC 34301]
MYHLDLNFGHGLRSASVNDDGNRSDARLADSDYESDSDVSDAGSDYSPWANLDRRLLQRIISFLPRQSDRRSFCLVSREWALAGESSLWAYPEFSTPKQLASFLRVVSDRPSVYGPHIRGIRFTLASHYDHHLMSPFYCDGDSYTEAELPTLMEVAQGKHVLSADPAIMRSLLYGSDLTSPPLALRFARMCSPIDRLSIYGFRLRDKYIVNDLMRWSLHELEIVGMPRKPLANLSYLLHNLRSLRSLRIESDSPLPADTWGPLALRLPRLHKLRIWAPSISGSHLLRAMNQAPQSMAVLHLVGRDNDLSDDFVHRIVQASPRIQSLVIHSANITACVAAMVLGACASLAHLELVRDKPQPCIDIVDGDVPNVVATKLRTLNLQNLDLPDHLIHLASSGVTSLRTLHIGGAVRLTGKWFCDWLNNCTCLAALGLFDCPRLSESLLSGLASGPSATTLRVLMIRQCAVQSEEVEGVLSAFPNIRHLSVVGVEVVRQQYEYVYDTSVASNGSETEAPQQGSSDIPVRRLFKPVYPPGHYFCKSDPAAVGCPDDEGVGGQVAAGDYHRAMWSSDEMATRFVPGLLAFANGAVDRGEPSVGSRSVGRHRASTISSEDHLDADESDVSSDSGRSVGRSPIRRMRSSSEQPSSGNMPAVAAFDESSLRAPYEHSRIFGDSAMESVLEQAEPVASEENELALAGVGRAIEPVCETAVPETGAVVVAEEPVAAGIDNAAAHELSVEPAVAEDAAGSLIDETRSRELDTETDPDSSNIAVIAGGVALALAAVGASLAVFGGEPAAEVSETVADEPAVDAAEAVADEPAVETVAEERAVDVAETIADEPAVEAAEAVAEERAVDVAETVADEPA